MTFAEFQVGRLALTEKPGGSLDDVFNASTLVQTAAWEGQESSPPLTQPELAARQADLVGLMGALVPVRWVEKFERNGYYEIVDVNTKIAQYGAEVGTVNWEIRGERVGADSEVEFESTLSGALTRTNAFSLVGERWHAPPPAAYAYGTTTGVPSAMTVVGAEGPLTLYRGLVQGARPRWGCPIDAYGGYRCRVLDGDGRERAGTRLRLPPTGWELSNGLARVRWPDAGGLRVAVHTGTAWAEKRWTVTAGSALSTPLSTVVVANDYERATIRCTFARNPGRTFLDLTVRRGGEVVELVVQTQPAASCAVALTTPESTTAPASAGYITAGANDSDGNRFFAGSAAAFAVNTGASSITRASTGFADFALGAVVGGSSAPTNRTAAALMARYLGAATESVRGCRR